MPTAGPGAHQPADTLANRTYLGLLAAQFLAAFNDQAIHAAAMFFAINTHTLSEGAAIAWMPVLFYAPWAVFCTLAGYLADRYSKRTTLVVWKAAEVAICAFALLGFWLGTDGGRPHVGAWMVLSTVFLMGTHSAFFVPAKYGVMPEILQPQLLSRGNGVLESLSFLAVILGTVSGGALSSVYRGREANIGAILLLLAGLGAAASLLIRTMPAANPGLRFPRYLYGPLVRNLRTLLFSRPLAFAVIGIAFFTFVVAFMRATVYMFGESQNPRWDELKTSAVVGTVALGVGLGSPLAGWLSGRKVELGLIPIGAAGMIVGCVLAGFSLGYVPGLVACTVLIGVCTGFYLVPLFTLLQYRAPKTSKGDMVASSNFINVTGAILASVLFSAVVGGSKKAGFLDRIPTEDRFAAGQLDETGFDERRRPVYFRIGDVAAGQLATAGRAPTLPELLRELVRELADPEAYRVRQDIEIDRSLRIGDTVIANRYRLGDVTHYVVRPASQAEDPEYDERPLPRYLFVGAGLMTLGVLLVLWRRVRDLPVRAATLVRSLAGKRFVPDGLVNVPGDGPVVLQVARVSPDALRAVRASVDRYVTVFNPNGLAEVPMEEFKRVMAVLARGDVVAAVVDDPAARTFPEVSGLIRIQVRVEGQVLMFHEPLPG
jgi:MFS family permease